MFCGKFFEMILIVSLGLALCALLNGVQSESAPYKTVQTHDGAVRGELKYTLFKNVSYYSFLGIPYAEKPTGSLRFKVCYAKYFDWNCFGDIFRIIEKLMKDLNTYFGFRQHNQLHHGCHKYSMHFNTVTHAFNNHLRLGIGDHNLKTVYI